MLQYPERLINEGKSEIQNPTQLWNLHPWHNKVICFDVQGLLSIKIANKQLFHVASKWKR